MSLNEKSTRQSHRFQLSNVLFWVIILCVALWASYLRTQFHSFRSADSACMAECVESLGSTGVPYSKIKSSVVDYFYNGLPTPILTASAEDLCQRSYHAPEVEIVNQFERHTYFIMYLLAPFTKFFSGEDISFFTIASGFCAFIVVLWVSLGWLGIRLPQKFLMCVIVISHPAWSLSFAYGEVYPDRLFVPLMLSCLALAMRPRLGWLFYIVGVLAVMTVDRAAFITGAAIIAYAVLFRLRDPAVRNQLLAFGALSIGYGIAVTKLVLITKTSGSLSGFLGGIWDLSIFDLPGFWPKVMVFLMVNAVLLLFAGFEWRALLIAIGCMLPNLLGNIGGAEKVGWSTHYHSLYFPVLVWAAALGMCKITRLLNTPRRHMVSVAGLVAALFYVVLLLPFVPAAGQSRFSFDNMKYNSVNIVWGWSKDFIRPLDYSSFKLAAKNRRELIRAVPPGTTVSAVRTTLITLFPGREVYYYPQGMDDAQYAVVNYDPSTPGDFPYSGLASFLPREDKMRAEACILQRLVEQFDVSGAQRIGSYVVLKRKQ